MFEHNPHIRNENILFCSLDWSGCEGMGVTESGIYWILKTNPENTLHMPEKKWSLALEGKKGELTNHTLITHMPQG